MINNDNLPAPTHGVELSSAATPNRGLPPLRTLEPQQRDNSPPPSPTQQNGNIQGHPQESGSKVSNYSGPQYPIKNGKRDYSRSLAQIANPDKVFDSDVTICFKDVSVAVNVPKEVEPVRHVLSPVVDAFNAIKTLGSSCQKKDLYRIKDCSGIIRPSETTLVIAGPGMGKSTFLKALSNRVALKSGHVAYNGRSFESAVKEGCDLKKMTQYVDQVDTHLPTLTVYETLDFAHKLTSVDYDPQRVEDSLTLLGLEECRDTIIGNAMIRGVSGGQRKRVTSGELLVSDASVLFLDEFSNGLDSSTSVDIMVGLKKFCLKYNSSVVATLQQPTPELFALFDRLVVLRDGQIVYQGPTDDVLPYFEAMGYVAPDDVDTADFLIDCLSTPRSVILRQREEDQHRAKKAGKSLAQIRASKPKIVSSTYGPLNVSPEPCITTEEMIEYYQTTPQWKEIKDELDESLPTDTDHNGNVVFGEPDVSTFKPLMPTQKSQSMYKLGYRLPIFTLLRYVLARQFTLFLRGKDTMIPRVIMAIFMSLIYGSLYYGIDDGDFVLRLASLVISITQVAFGNFIEIPISCQAQRVVMKQMAARFYPAWIYITSAAISGIPMSVVEGSIYGLFLYFMTNNYRAPLEFFTFWVTLVFISFQLGSWFRCIAAVGGDEQSSQSLAGPSTGVFTVFGGLFISRGSIPDFMIWLYWISPFSWSVRALANNEFLSPRYDKLISVTTNGITELKRQGDVYLQQIDMYVGSEWILWSLLYLLGLSIATMIFHSWLLHKEYYEESIGTRRTEEDEVVDADTDEQPQQIDNDDELLREQVHAAAVQQAEIQFEQSHRSTQKGASSQRGSATGAQSSQYNSSALKTLRENLPFVPAWLTFSDLYYTVKVKNQAGETVDRVLLNNVCGYAQPGKMLALMGASGAGKTTLLDVIAGLKNTGVVDGKILINGQPTSKDSIAALTGYVEQFDTLFPYSTVRETLEFAARLRLPASISDAIKLKIVDEILDILELTSISNYIIGNAKIQSLSPAQAKRVNIGVELVANPSILFLDEPTTGLDSKSAQTVMTVAKRIARSGRAIICTIHQPSAELFFLFDRLLLLGQGGHQIYFGDLGRRAKSFVDYLSQCPGVTPIAKKVNPASWMLVELGVGVQSEKGELEAKRATQAQNQGPTIPQFIIEDEPEWAELEPSKRTVQRFKKIYKQSEQFKKTRRRLDILESMEQIDPNDQAAIQRHKFEVEEAQQARLKKSTINNENQQDISKTTLPTLTVAFIAKEHPGVLQQLFYLFPRNFMAYWRNPPFLYARFTVVLVLSILFGLIYLGITPQDITSVTSLIGACFMGSIFTAVVHCSTAAPNFFEVRATFYREKAAQYYMSFLWALCQLLIELIWMIPGTIFCVIPVYFMVGLYMDAGTFFSYFFLCYQLIGVYVIIAMFFASLCPNAAAANVLQGAFMSFQSAVSGIAITLPKIPKGYLWLYRMLPGSHLFEALIMPQFKHNDKIMKYYDGTQDILKPVKEYVQEYLGWEFDNHNAPLWALLFMGVLLILTFVFTSTIAHNKR